MSDWQPIETCPGTDTVWLGIQGNLPWLGFKLPGGQWGRLRDLPPLEPPTHWMPILMPDPPADSPPSGSDGLTEFAKDLDRAFTGEPWEKRELDERKQDGRPSVIPYDPAKGMPTQHRKHDELYYLEKIQGDIKCIAGALELQSERLARMEKGLSTLRAQCIRIEGYADFLEMRTRAKRDFDSPAFTAGKDHLPR